MLTADGMAPPGAGDAKRLQLERRMLDLLVRSMHQMLATSIVIGPLLVPWLTWPHIGAWRTLTPMLLLLALGAERVLLLRRIARARATDDNNPRRWAQALAWRAALGSCIIITWFHFAATSGNQILLFEMLSLLTILAAGGAALFSSWPPVMWLVTTPLLLGMALQLVVLGRTVHVVGAVFCIVLWVVLVSSSLRSARTLHNEALARMMNDDLVRELQEKHAQAQAANAAKSRFFTAVNHDLRQPLQAMSLYLSTLQPHPEHLEQDETTLARMHQCMKALNQMLESLLDFSHLDSGRLEADLRTVALQPLFRHLASVHKAMARDQGLKLRVQTTDLWVCTDPMLLERALSNLLTNALRYTDQGGVLLTARQRSDHVQLCVVDTGIGIPEDAQELIYEEFVQLHRSPERHGKPGHGLGLATVRYIVTALGINIHLRSQVGRGSTFMLDVPAARPGDATGGSQVRPASKTQLDGQVLVVEDDAMVRDALVLQLTEWGLDVTAVGEGESACTEMARQPFDVVLSDRRLPGTMDGLAILREARARLPQLKLGLVITGEDIELAHLHEPEFPALRKPLHPSQLHTLLARHLRP